MRLEWIDSSNDPENESLAYARRVFSLIQQNGSIEFQSTEPEVPNIDEGTKLKDGTRVFRTSGTSGFQKKVYHDEETISNAVEGLVDRVGGSYSSYCCLPIYHVSGWMQVERAIRTGGNILFGDYKRLSKVDMSHELKGRWISLVPTQLYFLLQSKIGLKNLRSSRGVFVGGATLSSVLQTKARNGEIPVYPCYGMTETAGMITLLDSKDFLNGVDGVGDCLSHAEIKIVNGRVKIRSKSLCYQLGTEKICFDDWYETKDQGNFSEGYGYTISGRLDRCIISGGKNVYPEAIESCLRSNPFVLDCKIVGKHDEYWGKKVVAYIELTDDKKLNDIKKFARNKLSSEEIPKEWFSFDQFFDQKELRK